ncbi:hypothetical protein RND71_014832 [Anisodus tanguticus]|uniref:Uncharacterized protein n=1 Tax=Anisodus tanguticus TaxID=243964 RepID=A0AAE1VFD7_9SOLA|nr:hypothetical protein RND71_014832 [Anisodus tanguticus]
MARYYTHDTCKKNHKILSLTMHSENHWGGSLELAANNGGDSTTVMCERDRYEEEYERGERTILVDWGSRNNYLGNCQRAMGSHGQETQVYKMDQN